MESYTPGDIVYITDSYQTNYPAWKVAGKPATVLSVKHMVVKASSFSSKEDALMYRMRYGVRKEYNMFEMMVELDGVKYIVSQFGFVKNPDDKE